MPDEPQHQPGQHKGGLGGAVKKKVTLPMVAVIGLVVGGLAWMIWRGHQKTAGTTAAAQPGVPTAQLAYTQPTDMFGSQMTGLQEQMANLTQTISEQDAAILKMLQQQQQQNVATTPQPSGAGPGGSPAGFGPGDWGPGVLPWPPTAPTNRPAGPLPAQRVYFGNVGPSLMGGTG